MDHTRRSRYTRRCRSRKLQCQVDTDRGPRHRRQARSTAAMGTPRQRRGRPDTNRRRSRWRTRESRTCTGRCRPGTARGSTARAPSCHRYSSTLAARHRPPVNHDTIPRNNGRRWCTGSSRRTRCRRLSGRSCRLRRCRSPLHESTAMVEPDTRHPRSGRSSVRRQRAAPPARWCWWRPSRTPAGLSVDRTTAAHRRAPAQLRHQPGGAQARSRRGETVRHRRL